MAKFLLIIISTLMVMKDTEQRRPDGSCCNPVELVGNDVQFKQEHPQAFGLYSALSGRDGYVGPKGTLLYPYFLLGSSDGPVPFDGTRVLTLQFEQATPLIKSPRGTFCAEDAETWKDVNDNRTVAVSFICAEQDRHQQLGRVSSE